MPTKVMGSPFSPRGPRHHHHRPETAPGACPTRCSRTGQESLLLDTTAPSRSWSLSPDKLTNSSVSRCLSSNARTFVATWPYGWDPPCRPRTHRPTWRDARRRCRAVSATLGVTMILGHNDELLPGVRDEDNARRRSRSQARGAPSRRSHRARHGWHCDPARFPA